MTKIRLQKFTKCFRRREAEVILRMLFYLEMSPYAANPSDFVVLSRIIHAR